MNGSSGKRTIRVAIPYYGALVRPNVGIEKVYFIADVDLQSFTMKHVVLKVWNPKIRRELSDWIKKSGISGIICTEVCANFEDYLSRRDIWVKHAGSGDVQDLVEHWALSQEQQKGMPSIREAYNESETTLKPPHGGSQ